MSKKRCIIYETLGKVNNLVVESSHKDNLMRLTGVFGVVGIKNENNRIYDHDNYAMMVEGIKAQIASGGCPGELEHPNSMNIDLNNVSHKIESISMNGVVYIVDAKNIIDNLKNHPKINNHIAAADIIVLNKIDLVDKNDLASIKSTINKINPNSIIIQTKEGRLN